MGKRSGKRHGQSSKSKTNSDAVTTSYEVMSPHPTDRSSGTSKIPSIKSADGETNPSLLTVSMDEHNSLVLTLKNLLVQKDDQIQRTAALYADVQLKLSELHTHNQQLREDYARDLIQDAMACRMMEGVQEKLNADFKAMKRERDEALDKLEKASTKKSDFRKKLTIKVKENEELKAQLKHLQNGTAVQSDVTQTDP